MNSSLVQSGDAKLHLCHVGCGDRTAVRPGSGLLNKEDNMKKSCVLLSGLLLALNVAGCAGPNRALGEQTPDLVVYNDSTAIIGSITVSSDQESQGVTMADGTGQRRNELWYRKDSFF